MGAQKGRRETSQKEILEEFNGSAEDPVFHRSGHSGQLLRQNQDIIHISSFTCFSVEAVNDNASRSFAFYILSTAMLLSSDTLVGNRASSREAALVPAPWFSCKCIYLHHGRCDPGVAEAEDEGSPRHFPDSA
ncbi:hypothetical protein CMQ_2330 [Grosmannia clavigera kw1407]|uniref:Uncharacterized protein n=1 Tax=Grosmannia clavigera (strain kw1407 / UAMH 11150) TaxID=655863 RepID=F0XJP8_GROCL|nr:uncharacterized protein CMQ_2330 [Grosmannia clavigera kw1407]EFX02281.1 hypothetical protein CMQ_2330 [Grosmannia clavigera kw1407]